jgi:hypothetical protein
MTGSQFTTGCIRMPLLTLFLRISTMVNITWEAVLHPPASPSYILKIVNILKKFDTTDAD